MADKKGKEIKAAYIEPADYFPEEIRKEYKLGEFFESEKLCKIKSVMIGHAVGDALGVPVEFSFREDLKASPVSDMEGYGVYDVPAGAWSDDTSMSLCALDVLADGNVDWDKIMKNFVRWIEDNEFTPTGQTFDVGRTCLAAIITYLREKKPSRECGGKEEYSNGNGSLMRIHPWVLFAFYAMPMGTEESYWLWLALMRDASYMTHGHDRAVMGCYIYSFVLSFLLGEPTRESIVKALDFSERSLDYMDEFEHYARIFKPDFASLPESEIRSSGYVVDTLEAAIWCLLTTSSFRECVLKAVNLGRDTDTVAAVAGGLAGALYGYDAIPKEWRDKLIKREYIEEMCRRASENWTERD